MSFFPGKDPQAGDAYSCEAIAHVVVPRTVDLGDGFTVRRALPSAQSRMVGPFIFFDHFGPAEFKAGKGLDVRPHPHIGLATVTYLFDGEIMHRDSLGTAAAIRPGEVNWMTAGRGIVHSERTGPELRTSGSPIHGLQMWVGLPAAKEEMEAGFSHHPTTQFPLIKDNGKTVRVVVGSLYGAKSPVPTTMETIFGCFGVAGESDGAPISRSSARWFIGNSTTSRRFSRRQQHDDAVDAGRDAAMRRRAERSAIHAAEFRSNTLSSP
jgi:redox-sensitive bicupin YhaK (pirin superfamily)